MSDGDMSMDEANLSQSRWNDTHAAHNRVPAANEDEYRRDGIQKTSKGTTYRANGTNEAFERKLNAIVNENKAMTKALGEFRTALKEASVVNYNLAQIIKLISENATTIDEKREIINKFTKSAKTIDESKALYESISSDLKKAKKMSIEEEKQLSAESSKKLNETVIYKPQGMLNSLDLMHRVMNI